MGAEKSQLRHPGHIASHNILAVLALYSLAKVLAAVLRFPQASRLLHI
jgi:hypothetical protein